VGVVEELTELVDRIHAAVAPLEHAGVSCESSAAPALEVDDTDGGDGGGGLWDGVEVELCMADLGVSRRGVVAASGSEGGRGDDGRERGAERDASDRTWAAAALLSMLQADLDMKRRIVDAVTGSPDVTDQQWQVSLSHESEGRRGGERFDSHH
jgi:hypothetical protein